MTTTRTFATAISCIDGRAQRPVIDSMTMNLHVDFIDMITDPGADKTLSQGPAERIEDIRQKVLVSVNAHHSRVVAIAGHHDCAANPVTKEEHYAMIRQAMQTIIGWGLGVRVIGLYVNDMWLAELVGDTGPQPQR